MTRSSRRNSPLRPANADGGDFLPGEIVRAAWGGPLGFIESTDEQSGTAIVFWHTSRGYREIVNFKMLRRAAANPAFGPDVRDI